MDYCIFNAIKTPDGTVLWCKNEHDYNTHKDSVSGEEYMNDGIGYMIRRSVNTVPYEDLSVFTSDTHEKIRTAKFWGSYGKDGKGPRVLLALQDMEDSHLVAILTTQTRIMGTPLEKVFKDEMDFRKLLLAENLNTRLPNKNSKSKKSKI